ncbi:MAG: hypothetical protein JW827_12540 [Spirochaetes bacterium]|nr:hypothetical protein [Spirochaetota bacterium]
MAKLKESGVNKIIANLFILAITLVPLGILLGMFTFYALPHDNEILISYLQFYFYDKLIFFLPIVFLTALFYTLNASFPDSVRKAGDLKDKDIVNYYTKIAIVFILINLVLIEFLGNSRIFQSEKYLIQDRMVMNRKAKEEQTGKIFRQAQAYLDKKDYYKSLDLFQEILIILPDYTKAEDKVRYIEEQIIDQRQVKFKGLLNKGIGLYEKKKYNESAQILKQALDIEPSNRDALKYLNLSLQALNLNQKKVLKDEYSFLIRLYKGLTPDVRNRQQINVLMVKAKRELSLKNYLKAKSIYKQVLLINPQHYGANYYLGIINQRLSQITYYTSQNNKIFVKDTFYITTKGDMVVPEKIGKTGPFEYVFFNTSFYDIRNNRAVRKLTKKYGYYDFKNQRFEFINSFTEDKDPYYRNDIDPEIMWSFENLLKEPEKYPFTKIIKFYPYLARNQETLKKFKLKKLQDMLSVKNNSLRAFARIFSVKMNYIFLLITFFILSLSLSLIFRRKSGITKIGWISFIFLPLLAIIFDRVFTGLFYFTKRIIFIAQNYSFWAVLIAMVASYALISLFMFLLSLKRP